MFSKRRYRDRWNRTIVRQLARTRNHTSRVKARVRARGVTGQQFFNERRTELCRAKARTQQIWSLQLAGDWYGDPEKGRCREVDKSSASELRSWNLQCTILSPHPPTKPPHAARFHAARTPVSGLLQWHPNYETKCPALQPHYMRVMLTANLAVQDRMANGTAGNGKKGGR